MLDFGLNGFPFGDVLFTLCSIVFSLYFFQSALFSYGLFRVTPQVPGFQNGEPTQWPKISVVVAARNEEANIGRTLQSLLSIDYPRECFEIIIADGASIDRTAEIVRSYLPLHPYVKLIPVDLNRSLKGKANAIDQAVEASTGELILMTDADCEVEPTWAKTVVSHFNEDVGLVCGITLPKTHSLFTRIQAIDWAYILGTSSSLATLGLPIGGIGNNFNFRKDTYKDIGGYKSIKFSVTEDFMLFQTIARSRWKIAFPSLGTMLNHTEPMMTWSELYAQKKRWTLGALDASFAQSLYATLMFAAHALSLASFLIFPPLHALIIIGVKMLCDLLIIVPLLVRFKKTDYLFAFPLFEVYFYLYVLFVPLILAFSRKVEWKGIIYQVKES